MISCRRALPQGVPRARQRRIASSSASVCARLTHREQPPPWDRKRGHSTFSGPTEPALRLFAACRQSTGIAASRPGQKWNVPFISLSRMAIPLRGSAERPKLSFRDQAPIPQTPIPPDRNPARVQSPEDQRSGPGGVTWRETTRTQHGTRGRSNGCRAWGCSDRRTDSAWPGP